MEKVLTYCICGHSHIDKCEELIVRGFGRPIPCGCLRPVLFFDWLASQAEKDRQVAIQRGRPEARRGNWACPMCGIDFLDPEYRPGHVFSTDWCPGSVAEANKKLDYELKRAKELIKIGLVSGPLEDEEEGHE